MRDMELPGTEPHKGAILDDPDISCASCHGNYDTNAEPWYNWRGSMMGQAQRDPIFLACMTVAEQDAPSVGDLCIRCHSPGGWQEGRSIDTSGDMINVEGQALGPVRLLPPRGRPELRRGSEPSDRIPRSSPASTRCR